MVDMQHRIALGWAAFNRNSKVVTLKRVSHHLKAKIIDTYILSAVLYSLDRVNWTVKSLRHLATFQNHIMRRMKNKRLSGYINEQLNLKQTTSVIKSSVHKLYGYIKKSTHGVSNLCLEGKIDGKRSQIRQPKRWLDNVHLWTGFYLSSFNSATGDRTVWRIYHVGVLSATSGVRD